MWDTVDGESERLRSSTEEEETVWRLTRSSARVPIFSRSSLVLLLLCPATIPHLTLRPSAARRHSGLSTESTTGRPHNDKLARARPHARPVSSFVMRIHPRLDTLYEVISRSSSRTLPASDTTESLSSGEPPCSLQARPRRHDDRRLAPNCATPARAVFHSRGLGLLRSLRLEMWILHSCDESAAEGSRELISRHRGHVPDHGRLGANNNS
jgi:hypothetical protein